MVLACTNENPTLKNECECIGDDSPLVQRDLTLIAQLPQKPAAQAVAASPGCCRGVTVFSRLFSWQQSLTFNDFCMTDEALHVVNINVRWKSWQILQVCQ